MASRAFNKSLMHTFFKLNGPGDISQIPVRGACAGISFISKRGGRLCCQVLAVYRNQNHDEIFDNLGEIFFQGHKNYHKHNINVYIKQIFVNHNIFQVRLTFTKEWVECKYLSQSVSSMSSFAYRYLQKWILSWQKWLLSTKLNFVSQNWLLSECFSVLYANLVTESKSKLICIQKWLLLPNLNIR